MGCAGMFLWGLLVFLGTVAVGFVGMWSRNPAALPGAAPRGVWDPLHLCPGHGPVTSGPGNPLNEAALAPGLLNPSRASSSCPHPTRAPGTPGCHPAEGPCSPKCEV